MDEDWRNAFGILMGAAICAGAGRGYLMARYRLALVFILYKFLNLSKQSRP